MSKITKGRLSSKSIEIFNAFTNVPDKTEEFD